MNCPNCNENITDSRAIYCHNCGFALNQKKDASVIIKAAQKLWGLCKNNAKITLSIITCIVVGIGVIVLIKSCGRKEYIYLTPYNYVTTSDRGCPVANEYATTVKDGSKAPNEYSADKGSVKQNEYIAATDGDAVAPVEYATSEGEYLKLNEYVVTAKGGYGAYMREGPGTNHAIISVVRNGNSFMGAQSTVAHWIVIVEGNNIVGYIHDENVTKK